MYHDGSGYETAWPDLARCGWACVQVSCDGLPLRAVFGALPGARQTVGRAGRHALHQALLHMPYLRFVVMDLAALAREVDEGVRNLQVKVLACKDTTKAQILLLLQPSAARCPCG